MDEDKVPMHWLVAAGCATFGAWAGNKYVPVLECPVPTMGLAWIGFLWGLGAPVTMPMTACSVGVLAVLTIGDKTWQNLRKYRLSLDEK